MRPHSQREMRDYLYRKTLSKRYKSKRTGEIKEREGISKSVTERVYNRLVEKGHVDDEKFAKYWIENRNLRKGVSKRKLQAELQAKGVDRVVIEKQFGETERDDENEIQKVIAKKRTRYDDEQKLIAYLARQGFSYDDIKDALQSDNFED